MHITFLKDLSRSSELLELSIVITVYNVFIIKFYRPQNNNAKVYIIYNYDKSKHSYSVYIYRIARNFRGA